MLHPFLRPRPPSSQYTAFHLLFPHFSYRPLSMPKTPTPLPCAPTLTRSRKPASVSLLELLALVLVLLFNRLSAALSSFASAMSTCTPPLALSSRICWREAAAWKAALPGGGCGCLCASGMEARREEGGRSFSYSAPGEEAVAESLGWEWVIAVFWLISKSSAFWAAIRAFSYRALTSPPTHLVPRTRSQKVKKGWLKLVLMPQLWWCTSW